MKRILKDPRPNFQCNKKYGNPSNHAVFFASLISWFIAERIFFEKKFRFQNKLIQVFIFFLTPFVLYSRIYLNYHNKNQVNFL